MDENGKAEVSLPSATRTEAPVATQQENLICEVEKLEEKKDDNIVADKNTEVIDIKSEASESDNEDVIASQNEPGKNSDVNIDDEFEKVVPLKFKKLSEESTDEIDHEIEQILQEAKPLEIELPLEIAAEQSKDSENIKTSGETGLVDEKETDQQISSDIKPFSDSNKSFEIASFQPESQQKSEFAENIFKPKITQASIEIEIKPQVSTKPIELISNTENIEVKPQDLKVSITEIQEKPLHIENNESSTPGDLSNDKISEALSSEALVSEDEQKPPVPIPTYLWEDVKKSKEQGGYPWTHLYKQPLGDNEEPEIILNYKHSPRSSRKHFDSESGTPKSQKKVRIQDEIEVKETENYIQDLSDQEAEGGEKAINKDDAEPSETFEDNEKILDEQKSPKSILKGSKNIAENIKPKESKFDSGSLKKKIKNPLQKIKKMADQQFKKVKSSKPSIKKIPVSKNDLALNDELKILKLKESPKSQHREITSYVVKQDSEDSLEILELDESPMENRKRKKAENVMVKPDEIIDLPLSDDSKENISQTNEQKEQSDNEQRESTVESHEISISGSSSHSKDGTSKKRDHVYEDIEEYISRITSDKENVERVAFEHDEKLERKPQPGEIDPVFDEFSRELNKRIRRSLSVHDEKTRQDFAEEIPQIKMLETHLSSQENQDDNDKKISKKNKKMKKQKSTEHEDEENSTTLSAVETKIENLISKITSDNEHVERASFEEDPRLEPKPGEIDPVFDEFSRELNKRIRRSLSVHDEKLRQEISEEITHAKELDETSIEKNLSKVTSEGVTEEHEIPGNDSMSNRKIDPIFDEFSKDINNSIRKSLTTQDEKYRQELAKKIPRIEELEKQISDEDKEEKIEEISDVHIKHLHLLAPISSIDSTSSDEDRKTQLSILAEESETSDNKKKSFDDSSVDREIESLKNDGSDISTTLIEDVNKIKDESKETNLSIEENKNNDKTLKQSPSKPQDDSCQIVKEDVFVKLPQESSKKINSRWSKMSDHEYEPISDPNENVTDLDQPDTQNSDKKLLRTPTEDSEDNISAQDFQNEIENRFFKQEIAPIVDDETHVHQENTFEEAVIIDEGPVTRELPKKRNIITSAQEQGKNLHKKIKAQAGMLKSSLGSKMKRKPKEKPVAAEVAKEDEEMTADVEMFTESEVVETVTVQPKPQSKSKTFKMPNFAKNIKKPSLPKFKKSQSNKPDEISSSEVPTERPSLPELKIGERFARFRKLGRSKSLKEESATNDSESFTTPEIATAEPTKKRFHFGTYPRMIRDKFKKQKLPERSDQSVRSESPPIVEFKRVTETFTQRGPVASRWPEYHQDSEKYQQFHSESEIDRESSIERRMRLDYDRSTEEREDFEIVKRLLSEEQKQLDDMENENHEIHLMAQERYKKSAVERQSSDDDKMLWSGMLNKDVTDEFHEPNALKFDDSEKYALDYYKNESDLNRSYTPQTNQETQSSGSSETRRRKGILDEEDDYFLRENRISNEIHIGDYISSAIKEGLSSPEDNALSKMGKYDEKKSDFIPDKPIRSLKRKNKKNQEDDGEDDNKWNRENTLGFKEFYKTFPEAQQGRHQTKSFSTEGDAEEDIDLNRDELVGDSFDVGDEIIDDLSEQDSYYRQQILKGLEHPDLILAKDDFDNDLEYNLSNLPVPPTPPRRRKKKKIRAFQPFVAVRNESITDKTPLAEQNITVFQSQQKYVPLAQEEYFTTPTPTPRRTRSRSEISAHTLDDAESFKKDSVEGFTAFHNQDKENGYALVRKETPSRPVRRKRSTKSLGERQFATMPHMKRDGDTPPHRPVRNYSTIIPSKPPRTKSTGSLVEISKTIKNDDDDYEEILDNNDNSIVHQRLKSGEIVKKMKDRPLPPPPRPKRENKKNKKDDGNNDDNKFDKDDGAEKVIESLTIETDTENVFLENIHDVHESEPFASASLPRQDSDLSEPDKVIEVEVSTQTDPVPDEEFICDDDEDENIDIDLGDEFLTSNGKMKTLEDILKEEQEAEIERARQLAEAENLSRGIQRFRDSSQRSLSERSKASGDRSRSLSRPITPSAVLVEQKKSSPIMFNNEEQTLTEAGLFIHPITYDDFGRPPSEEESNLIEQTTEALDVNNNFELVNIINEPTTQQNEPTNITLNIIPQDDLNLDSEQTPNDQEDVAGDKEKDDEYFDRDMQRKIEEMIESVMNSARDEVDLIKTSNDNVVEEVKDEIEALQAPPLPPPRRKSNIETAEKTNEIKESSRVDGTQNDSKMLSPHENQTHQEEFSALEQVQSDFHGNQLSNRLHLPNLEIDNLSVHSLQAGRIVASEIDSNTIVTNELECKSSHNITSDDKPIEFPPGFIEEIVERVRNAERVEQHKQHDPSQQPQRVADDENAPVRPPLPTEFNYSAVPPAFYQLRDNSEEDAVHHQSVPQRRRRHQNRKRDSTSEEDYQKGQRTKSRGGTSSDQSVLGAGSQFIRACGNALKESGGQLMEILRASSKDENKRDLHLALVILIIIVAGLILMGMGDKSVHHHHWDFFNPPDNHGR